MAEKSIYEAPVAEIVWMDSDIVLASSTEQRIGPGDEQPWKKD
ncbi:MAG: hypothetical protein ACI3XR_01225 [Eubacteriales bacterium]